MELNFSKKWGPYLSDRQWGVVREDYSADGDAWDYSTHDQARSKAWRWGEDGIGGVSDDRQFLCIAPAFWNGRDPIIKERLFGLTNTEGNHGEDVKELFYYLDAAPDHRYLRMLYKYPHAAFPYQQVIEENKRRSRLDPEFEITQTGVFDQNRYFDIFIEYALGETENDILMKITVENRASEAAWLAVLPTIWFRNTWSYHLSEKPKPTVLLDGKRLCIRCPELGTQDFFLYAADSPEFLFCENETNFARVFHGRNKGSSTKDAINAYLTDKNPAGLNVEKKGTKAAAFYQKEIPAGGSKVFMLRLMDAQHPILQKNAKSKNTAVFADFDTIFAKRRAETDLFYESIQKNIPDPDRRAVQRQAWAGMIWNKQFYYYQVPRWLEGDPGQPKPPSTRWKGRNADWQNFESEHILSMPDKWEYPWFAAWDLAFHAVIFAHIDPIFAKEQLLLLHSQHFRRSDGTLPAYEWNFDDLNPPVQAWAAWRVFEIEKTAEGGTGDFDFLTRIFPDLRAAYNWWMSQKDDNNNDLFSGGFLGLDNIGVFNRSESLPNGFQLEQADATAWAAFYALQMLRIALKLAQNEPSKCVFYQNEAFDFFKHFLQIAYAIGSPDDQRTLWDDEDGFFYDNLRDVDDSNFLLKVRSLVGLIPMLSVLTLDDNELAGLPVFKKNAENFLETNADLASMISRWHDVQGEKRLLSMLRGHRLKCLLKRMLDPNEFLSDYGVRSLSKYYLDNPFKIRCLGEALEVGYLPGESDSGVFGGNSNWRGPIWMPINFLLIESLMEFNAYFGAEFRVECPVGSGKLLSLCEVAHYLSNRLTALFLKNKAGYRPLHGSEKRYGDDPFFCNLVLFYEYFDGDTGRGCGASHQTGWTGLAANLMDSSQFLPFQNRP